jgi:hypothetical protein
MLEGRLRATMVSASGAGWPAGALRPVALTSGRMDLTLTCGGPGVPCSPKVVRRAGDYLAVRTRPRCPPKRPEDAVPCVLAGKATRRPFRSVSLPVFRPGYPPGGNPRRQG